MRTTTTLNLLAALSTTTAFVQQPQSTRTVTTTTTSASTITARHAKSMDDAMDNDWRLFRAKLVAQEKANNGQNWANQPPVYHFQQPKRKNATGGTVPGFGGMPNNHQINWHHSRQQQQQPPLQEPPSSPSYSSSSGSDALGHQARFRDPYTSPHVPPPHSPQMNMMDRNAPFSANNCNNNEQQSQSASPFRPNDPAFFSVSDFDPKDPNAPFYHNNNNNNNDIYSRDPYMDISDPNSPYSFHPSTYVPSSSPKMSSSSSPYDYPLPKTHFLDRPTLLSADDTDRFFQYQRQINSYDSDVGAFGAARPAGQYPNDGYFQQQQQQQQQSQPMQMSTERRPSSNYPNSNMARPNWQYQVPSPATMPSRGGTGSTGTQVNWHGMHQPRNAYMYDYKQQQQQQQPQQQQDRNRVDGSLWSPQTHFLKRPSFGGGVSDNMNSGVVDAVSKSQATNIDADRAAGQSNRFDAHGNNSNDLPNAFTNKNNNVLDEDPFITEMVRRQIEQADVPCRDNIIHNKINNNNKVNTGSMMTTTAKIDKHRWAHELPGIEPGAVLLAHERVRDAYRQTVVLITQHHEVNGTYGIIINRPMEGNLMNICKEPSTTVDLSLKMTFRNTRVGYGGPCEPNEYTILHSYGPVSGATKLCHGVYLGGSQELRDQVRSGTMNDTEALFVKGHIAWDDGLLLQQELMNGVWYLAAVSTDFILRYAGVKLTAEDNPDNLWKDIMMCMGGHYANVARRSSGSDAGQLMP